MLGLNTTDYDDDAAEAEIGWVIDLITCDPFGARRDEHSSGNAIAAGVGRCFAPKRARSARPLVRIH